MSNKILVIGMGAVTAHAIEMLRKAMEEGETVVIVAQGRRHSKTHLEEIQEALQKGEMPRPPEVEPIVIKAYDEPLRDITVKSTSPIDAIMHKNKRKRRW